MEEEPTIGNLITHWFDMMELFDKIMQKGDQEQKKWAVRRLNQTIELMQKTVNELSDLHQIDLQGLTKKMLEEKSEKGEEMRKVYQQLLEVQKKINPLIEKMPPERKKGLLARKRKMERDLRSRW